MIFTSLLTKNQLYINSLTKVHADGVYVLVKKVFIQNYFVLNFFLMKEQTTECIN